MLTASSASSSSTAESSSSASGSRCGNEDSTPELSPPPRKKFCKKKYYHSYNKGWENDMEWLSSSPKGSRYGYCKNCDKHLLCGEGGVRDLKRHSETEGHKKMSKAREGQRSLHRVLANQRSTAAKSARAEAILANMLVEHNLPFLLMDHLPGVIRHAFPDSKIAKDIKSARTKTTAVVKHALAPASHASMVSGVLASPAYSLLMDESTDRGDKKRVGMLIRYYDQSSFRITTGFLGLYDIPQANAANLFECLDFQLRQDNINYSNLIGWNSDGANVMMGTRNSVVS